MAGKRETSGAPATGEHPGNYSVKPLCEDRHTEKTIAFFQERRDRYPEWWPALSFSYVGADGEKGKFETRVFEPDTNGNIDWHAVDLLLETRQGIANSYFSLNSVKPDTAGKADRASIVRVLSLHVDIDPRAGETPEDCKSCALKRAVEYKVKPTYIIDSGGGLQLIWDLIDPIEINGDLERAEDAKLYNIQLEHDFGGDHCHNIDRILRTIETENVPDKKKLQKGRRRVNAHIIGGTGQQYTLSSFTKAKPAESSKRAVGGAEAKSSTLDNGAGATRAAHATEPVMRLDDPRLARVRADVKLVISDGRGERYPSRSEACFAVACDLVRIFIPDAVIRSVFENFSIGDSLRDASRKFDEGVARLIERAHLATDNPDLTEMNERFSAGSVSGKFRVVGWVPDLRHPYQRIAQFSSKGDFCNGVVNPKISVPDEFDGDGNATHWEKKARSHWWLGQDGRQEFDGIDYRPGQPEVIEVKDRRNGRKLRILNMYSGFSVGPDFVECEKKCALYLAHVYDNVAGGNAELSTYIIDWMASGVQHPDNPGRSALSMRGDPGAGKGIFALYYGGIFGRHFLHVTQKEHVTGKFNSHSAETCLLFVDEALYAEIRADAQILKTLTTESTKILERKGIDAVQIENFTRLIFATNEEHPIRIEYNDRRYCAIYVSVNPAWANEPDEQVKAERRAEYFLPILAEMKNGGRAALLGFLLQRDISWFNPERIPATTERNVQKLMSASAGDKLVIEFAIDGNLPGAVSAKRPWLARANGEGCLYPSMRERGGGTLARMSDMALSDLLKDWGFKRHPLGDGAGWAAPMLETLRGKISLKYPGMCWDRRIRDWGAGVCEMDIREADQDGDNELPI
jgi:hypothetical protein